MSVSWDGPNAYSSCEDVHLAQLQDLLCENAAEQSDGQNVLTGVMNAYLVVGLGLMLGSAALKWHGAVLFFGVTWLLDLVGQPWKVK